MFLLTSTPTREEREAALATVPWHERLRPLAGTVAGALRNQSVDLIDLSLGGGHGRAALVALQEGVDGLLQATLDLAESVVREAVLAREHPLDPLGVGEAMTAPENLGRIRVRFARTAIEDAAIRAVSSLDHLVNGHLRLAWEANAATEAEMRICGFDPRKPEPKTWASSEQVRNGLRQLDKQTLGVFPAFVLTEPFRKCAAHPATMHVRDLRNEVVHRARPSYREAPAFGRASLWSQPAFKLTLPLPDDAHDHLPTLSDRRALVGDAIAATLPYAEASWNTALRWLGTVGVTIVQEPGQVRVTTEQRLARDPHYPRASRDPGPFLT